MFRIVGVINKMLKGQRCKDIFVLDRGTEEFEVKILEFINTIRYIHYQIFFLYRKDFKS